MKIYDSPNSSVSVTSPNSANDDFYQVNMEFERKGLLIESMKTHKREVKLFFQNSKSTSVKCFGFSKFSVPAS